MGIRSTIGLPWSSKRREKLEDALIDAAWAGNLSRAEKLLRWRIEINCEHTRRTDYRTALICACHKGHWELARLLLARGADASFTDRHHGHNALIIAAAQGDLKTVTLMLAKGANIEPETKDYALRAAVDNGHGAIAQALIEGGANVNSEDAYGRTALVIASNAGPYSPWKKWDLVRLLIDTGSDVNVIPSYGGYSALMSAASEGELEIVWRLLERGADVNAKTRTAGTDRCWNTPLMLAAAAGKAEVVSVLLDSGAKIDAVDSERDTALIFAARTGERKVLQYLLDSGADVNAEGSVAGTALIVAAGGGYLDVVHALLARGAEVNAKARSWKGQNGDFRGGITALINASDHGRIDVVKLLINSGAEVNASSNEGGTALIAASRVGCLEVVRLLLDRGAEFNARDNRGCTALMAAAEPEWRIGNDYASLMPDRLEVIRQLLDRGAQINAIDDCGETALDYAERVPELDRLYDRVDPSLVPTLLRRAGGKKGYEVPRQR
jgi:ankyrin repeat protein